jgi:hypothetical protein
MHYAKQTLTLALSHPMGEGDLLLPLSTKSVERQQGGLSRHAAAGTRLLNLEVADRIGACRAGDSHGPVVQVAMAYSPTSWAKRFGKWSMGLRMWCARDRRSERLSGVR